MADGGRRLQEFDQTPSFGQIQIDYRPEGDRERLLQIPWQSVPLRYSVWIKATARSAGDLTFNFLGWEQPRRCRELYCRYLSVLDWLFFHFTMNKHEIVAALLSHSQQSLIIYKFEFNCRNRSHLWVKYFCALSTDESTDDITQQLGIRRQSITQQLLCGKRRFGRIGPTLETDFTFRSNDCVPPSFGTEKEEPPGLKPDVSHDLDTSIFTSSQNAMRRSCRQNITITPWWWAAV